MPCDCDKKKVKKHDRVNAYNAPRYDNNWCGNICQPCPPCPPCNFNFKPCKVDFYPGKFNFQPCKFDFQPCKFDFEPCRINFQPGQCGPCWDQQGPVVYNKKAPQKVHKVKRWQPASGKCHN